MKLLCIFLASVALAQERTDWVSPCKADLEKYCYGVSSREQQWNCLTQSGEGIAIQTDLEIADECFSALQSRQNQKFEEAKALAAKKVDWRTPCATELQTCQIVDQWLCLTQMEGRSIACSTALKQRNDQKIPGGTASKAPLNVVSVSANPLSSSSAITAESVGWVTPCVTDMLALCNQYITSGRVPIFQCLQDQLRVGSLGEECSTALSPPTASSAGLSPSSSTPSNNPAVVPSPVDAAEYERGAVTQGMKWSSICAPDIQLYCSQFSARSEIFNCITQKRAAVSKSCLAELEARAGVADSIPASSAAAASSSSSPSSSSSSSLASFASLLPSATTAKASQSLFAPSLSSFYPVSSPSSPSFSTLNSFQTTTTSPYRLSTTSGSASAAFTSRLPFSSAAAAAAMPALHTYSGGLANSQLSAPLSPSRGSLSNPALAVGSPAPPPPPVEYFQALGMIDGQGQVSASAAVDGKLLPTAASSSSSDWQAATQQGMIQMMGTARTIAMLNSGVPLATAVPAAAAAATAAPLYLGANSVVGGVSTPTMTGLRGISGQLLTGGLGASTAVLKAPPYSVPAGLFGATAAFPSALNTFPYISGSSSSSSTFPYIPGSSSSTAIVNAPAANSFPYISSGSSSSNTAVVNAPAAPAAGTGAGATSPYVPSSSSSSSPILIPPVQAPMAEPEIISDAPAAPPAPAAFGPQFAP